MKSRLGDRCGSESARAVGQFLREADSWVAPLGLADWFCDLTLVGDGVMRDLNGRYRGRDAVTDVLSFSALEETGSLPPDLPGGQAGAHADLWLDSLQAGEPGGVGEIILAPDFIARRCAENGWPLAGEIPMLVVHGCLHLLGWDHEDEEQGRAMRLLETEILAACGLKHPLGDGKGDGS